MSAAPAPTACRGAVPGLVVLSLLVGLGSGLAQTRPSDVEVERLVRIAFGDEDLEGIEVAVESGEVTLTGRARTLWVKWQAVEKALGVHGVDRVVSEITVPRVEDDRELARQVADSVVNYPFYTTFDYVQGGVSAGVVSLAGYVTPERDKVGEITERVARIPGVQDVASTLETLPPSATDMRLRRVLADKIFDNDFFARYARLRVPPFHIIVRRGTVTLTGVVRDDVEKGVMEQVVRRTVGVTQVINHLTTER